MGFWYLWGGLCGILLIAGILDKQIHQYFLGQIPTRVNVNGTRGKSTVTRLITGSLREAGNKVVGKTTGTAARMIFWDEKEEMQVVRKGNLPNIHEQCKVIRLAAQRGAEYLVSECMAVRPEYQLVFARQLLKNNIGVIVNTLPDHLDVMGPTTREVAKALSATIPYNGLLIIIEDEFTPFYKQVADKRHCEVRVADPSKIPQAYLDQFPYFLFPENVALALEVALALGIEREVALQGMLKARPDPGVLTITPLRLGKKEFMFANAFAANDPVSTMVIYQRLAEKGYQDYPLVVLANCRADRVDRTKQMANEVLPNLSCSHLIAIGSATRHIKQNYEKKLYHCDNLWDLEDVPADTVLKKLEELPENSLIFGIGNIHGTAEELLKSFYEQDQQTELWIEWREQKLVHI